MLFSYILPGVLHSKIDRLKLLGQVSRETTLSFFKTGEGRIVAQRDGLSERGGSILEDLELQLAGVLALFLVDVEAGPPRPARLKSHQHVGGVVDAAGFHNRFRRGEKSSARGRMRAVSPRSGGRRGALLPRRRARSACRQAPARRAALSDFR